MKIKYTTYQQSKSLKKLGYDLPCERYYREKDSVTIGSRLNHNMEEGDTKFSAPYLSDVQTWFREKHKIEVNAIWCYLMNGWSGYYSKMNYPGLEENTEKYYESYEEALSEAINIAIENLL